MTWVNPNNPLTHFQAKKISLFCLFFFFFSTFPTLFVWSFTNNSFPD